jgi:hypothetical protein
MINKMDTNTNKSTESNTTNSKDNKDKVETPTASTNSNKTEDKNNTTSTVTPTSTIPNTKPTEIKAEDKIKSNSTNQEQTTPGINNSSNIPQKTKECKIRFINNNKIYFEFDNNYVLTLPLPESFDQKNKTIKITHTSDIGKPDFSYDIDK